VKDWFTAAEIAGAALPDMPTTERAVQIRAQKDGWAFRKRQGRGGGREYSLTSLPPAARAHLLARTAPAAPPATAVAKIVPAGMRDHQRQRMDARLALLAELDRIAEAASVNQAVKVMIELAASDGLAPHLQALVPVANARAGEGGERTLSRRSLLRWRAERKRGAAALAPRDGREKLPPAWGAALLQAFARPQKPSLMAALATVALPPGIATPSYHQARRFLAKMSVVERNRGRMGPRDLKTLRAFKRRDVSDLEPLDVISMDGHTFDAEIAHPAHGRPFRPEVTTAIDVATRKVVGLSADLAESAQAVTYALGAVVRRFGVPAILYVDRGSAYEAQVFSSATAGLLARLGTRHETSLPYNSQARGQIERLHRSLWVRAAKELPTYVGADMDAEAKKNVFRLTRAAVQPFSPPLLKPWDDFRTWAVDHVAAYNARPHRGLPKIRDEATGALRHLSPNEAWAAAVAKGWQPVTIAPEEIRELFLPAVERVTRRGEVSIAGNVYFHRALEHLTGERVLVAYDPFDAAAVIVKDLEGRVLCEAALDGNRTAYFPQSVIEQARDERARGRERRLMAKLDEVRAERAGPPIEAEARPLDPESAAIAEQELARIREQSTPPALPPAAANDEERPTFHSDIAHFEWCVAHRDRMTAMDVDVVRQFLSSKSARQLHHIDDETAVSFGVPVDRGAP
jgi:putative transposase